MSARRPFLAWGLALGLAWGGAFAAPRAIAAVPDAGTTADAREALDARESRLAHELRCVVCQNQTIAESNAPLAADMRQVIREQLRDGRSDADIVAFFEQRYGAFVRYSPPWQPSTWLLWTGPFVLLAIGLAGLGAALRRRGAFEAAETFDGDDDNDESVPDDLIDPAGPHGPPVLAEAAGKGRSA